MDEPRLNIALIGNPNCGKTTLFNRLTGLRQKTSNLPGTTVDQKRGIWKTQQHTYYLNDLPGIYSLYTHSEEEIMVVESLLGIENFQKPDILIYVMDASNLRRNLLLFSQVSELGIPAIAVLTMNDTAKRRGLAIDMAKLEGELGIKTCNVNPKTGEGYSALELNITEASISQTFPFQNHIEARLVDFFNHKEIKGLAAETLLRYKRIETVVQTSTTKALGLAKNLTHKLDKIFTHKLWGFLAFAAIMLTIFQGVFTLADYPMTWIENGFAILAQTLKVAMPNVFLSHLLIDGILPGLAGVLVFIPQIAILFFFISILEDSGYMVRASFITDNLMRKLGLNGRSVIPLIGGFACAIPSILATRSIKNRHERIATMFVIPLMSCSARLPVYVLLVAIAVPTNSHWGPFGLQSVVMTSAYFLGIILAAIISKAMYWFRKKEIEGEFILEMPAFQMPRMENVLKTVWYKSASFVQTAGKIILFISIVLWFLSSYGPGDSIESAKRQVTLALSKTTNITQEEKTAEIAKATLEASYAGQMGKFIEPAIEPLGYDWKTGIALISSFVAREVFVGTMNTLFPNNSGKDIKGIRSKMQSMKNPKTGKPLYGAAYALSLIVFYAFALQCVSTLAVMRRETGGWKWPILQFTLFGTIAYIASFITFNLANLFL